MTTYREYPGDLASLSADPVLARLVADLDRLHTAGAAPPAVSAGVARLAAQQAPRPAPSRSFGLPRRPRYIAVVGIAAALILTGSVLADLPLVDQALGMFGSGGQVVSEHIGSAVSVSRSVCGYTMTINRVYADANRIVVGYTLSGPAGRTIEASPSLSDTQGHVLPPLEGMGTAMVGNESGHYVAWDASALAGTPGPLAMHLVVPSLSVMAPLSSTNPANTGCETSAPLPKAADPAGAPAPGAEAPPVQALTVAGPLSFDLSIPVDSRVRTADLHQTARSTQQTEVTLERIVVTPSETRLTLRGPATGDVAGGPAIVATLEVDGREIFGGAYRVSATGEVSESFPNALYDAHGDWVVRVLTDPRMTDGSRHYTDTLTFHLSLP